VQDPLFGQRDRAALWANRLGLTSVLDQLPCRNRLVVVNYHRIGDYREALNPNLYSATVDELETQIQLLKRRYRILNIDEAIDYLRGGRSGQEAAALITFDDGYLDNYELAFPVLRDQQVPATFFLTTSHVGSSHLTASDQIAHLLRNPSQARFTLSYPRPLELDLQRRPFYVELRRVLQLYKATENRDPDRFFDHLRSHCPVDTLETAERRFVNWDEAATMASEGMTIGSHTCTHPILSRLSLQDQIEELTDSKRLIEQKLGRPTRSIAYPVGSLSAFSATTQRAAAEAGYEIAFSHYGGFNEPGRTNLFDVRRNSVLSRTGRPRFRFRVAMARASGRWWF